MLQCKMSVVSNQWVKMMEFMEAGDTMAGHKHTFDHNTLLAIGDFIVTVEGVDYEYRAPRILKILKGKEHAIRCTSDYGLAFCLHIIRDGERVEDIVDPEDIPGLSASLLGKTPLTRP